MKKYSSFNDNQIKEALQGNNKLERSKMIEHLSKAWFSIAASVIDKTGGDKSYLEDLFQESLTAFVKSVMLDNFRGNSKMTTYFYSICRLRCLNKYKLKQLQEFQDFHLEESDSSSEELLIDNENIQNLKLIISDLMKRVGSPCSEILTYFSQNYKMKEIAEILGYSNPDTVKNQASRCRKQLRTLVLNNPVLTNQLKSFI